MTIKEKIARDEMKLNFALGDYMPLPQASSNYGEHSLKRANKTTKSIRPNIRPLHKNKL